MSDLDQGRPHKPADDKEEVYFEGSPLLRGDLGRLIVAAIIAAVLVAIPILNQRFKWFPMPLWVWPVAIVLAAICLLVPIILTRTIKYKISNYRIDYERGILSKKYDTLELWHVDDVSMKQSLLDRIFGTGDITVVSNDESTPHLQLHGVPNPKPLFDSLKQRVIAVKRQRGVIKMDT
ncbi:MAG TPA: PH domain-containing protein [Tepidisphaeraceae bacterium]|jgi:membrane protein YdbS with pleckstrin-like domain|nr:PH domain-containing protein [Tepidisphaeraceae bacterium]